MLHAHSIGLVCGLSHVVQLIPRKKHALLDRFEGLPLGWSIVDGDDDTVLFKYEDAVTHVDPRFMPPRWTQRLDDSGRLLFVFHEVCAPAVAYCLLPVHGARISCSLPGR